MTQPPVAASPRIDWADLPEHVRAAVESALGGRVASSATQLGGFSPGTAARVVLDDGRRAFVKAVSPDLNPVSPQLHRKEARALALLPPGTPAPALLHVYDDGYWVALVLEDIDGRHPSVPWTNADAHGMADALTAVAGVRAPTALPRFAEASEMLTAWDEVVADPHGIDLRVRDRLGEMTQHQAVAREVTFGDSLVHWDARADNALVRSDGAVVLLDWAWACRGAPWLDLLLLGVEFLRQGGPDPDEFLAEQEIARSVPRQHLAAVLACMVGVWFEKARQPAPPGLPTIREWQAHCGGIALDWLDNGALWT